jgi:hypothetical protein
MPIIKESADLDTLPKGNEQYPADIKNQLTIGDLHGNALKLIYFLVRQNVLVIKPGDYAEIVDIYKKNELEKKDLKRFNSILTKIKIQPVGTVRLIGDEVADRGMNDYFTLKVLNMLQSKGVPIEIIISNHGVEFVEACETKSNFIPPRLGQEHAGSIFALQKLIDKGLVTRREALQMAHDGYKSFLRALSYTLSEDKTKITIYSHAGIGLNTIKALAEKLGLTYSDETAEELAQTINNINIAFQKHVENKTVNTLYKNEIMQAGYEGVPINQNENPFEFLMWNRCYDNIERPEKHIKGYSIDFVHGHDTREVTNKNIYNLDNMLGKSPRHHQGEYHILYSQETSGPQFVIKQEEVHEIKCKEIKDPIVDEEKNLLEEADETVRALYEKIEVMNKYGESFKKTDSKKGKIAVDLSADLKKLADNFFGKPQTQAAFKRFQYNFSVKLHSQDDQMNEHRKSWKPILANISIALTGIGALILGCKLIYSKLTTGKFSFFFDTTQRQQQVEAIENAAQRLTPPAAKCKL